MKTIVVDGVNYVPESFYATEFKKKGEVVKIEAVMPHYFKGGDYLELRLMQVEPGLAMPTTKFTPGMKIRIIVEE